MAVLTLDCAEGKTFMLVNAGSGLQTYLVCSGAGCTPDSYLEIEAHQTLQFPCAGVLRFEDNGFTSTGYTMVPIPIFPYQSALMGLAGLLAGAIFAAVISRVGRGKGG